MDVRHVGVAVVNHDSGELSREMIADMSATPFFSVVTVSDYAEALENVSTGKVDVILEIPADMQKSIGSRYMKLPHVTANGVNGIKGSLGSRYVSVSIMKTMVRFAGRDIEETVEVSYLYNPTLEYRNNMIPSLMSMLLIMLCGFLPALNLVGEKESGTIEQINVTPVRTPVFVLSKVMPYWIIGIVVISLAMLISAFVYGLRPAGSVAAIYIATMLFIFVMSGIGIIIANGSNTMSQSMFLMFFIVMLFVLMSGLLTPVSSMPVWAQYITYALPPRYFIDIMRSVYLKATEISSLSTQYIALAVFAILANVLAALTYRKQR